MRKTDELLDMGCAEGLITLAASRKVKCVTGVDVNHIRIAAARRTMVAQGITNADFIDGSLPEVDGRTFDVIFFLAVFGKALPDGGSVGMKEVRRLLEMTRRQLYISFQAEHFLADMSALFDCCRELGFSCVVFARTSVAVDNLIVCSKIDSDAKIKSPLSFVFLPSKESPLAHLWASSGDGHGQNP